MSDDFMGGMFDFNGDGHTDSGEEFMAYQNFEDSTGGHGHTPPPVRAGGRLTGYHIFLIVLVAYAILDACFR